MNQSKYLKMLTCLLGLLVLSNGFLYEGVINIFLSSLTKVNLETAKQNPLISTAKQIFVYASYFRQLCHCAENSGMSSSFHDGHSRSADDGVVVPVVSR